ncbi:3-hydroxyanthranilate 3,4-dioxygenase isoform X2 [Clupea harengus]|uniref:3-hydroxyanthranilate 3,4-dioxygenase n=1 Tax=Clupea harengus TaxID=7950 RepID=A0A6P3VWC8_CLUHA|nr:3-hydroxyanthranilate 3,4-dioxygenase isoform X2 [Clupea harengus]
MTGEFRQSGSLQLKRRRTPADILKLTLYSYLLIAFVEMANESLFVNVNKWILENEHAFLPPVCNKLMHFRQLNIMFVGGPNTRKDYHIEEGEELFYQIRGDMCLKIVENGKHKDIHIREGEMFLLPARIPHSPQRQANTVGLVVERRRLLTETDALRYHVDNSTDILWERWFYCKNLGTQLAPVIKEFFASEEHRTGKPNPDPPKKAPFPLNTASVMAPFSFKDRVDGLRADIASSKSVDMFGPEFETEVLLWGPGETNTTKHEADRWIWQLEGTSEVTLNHEKFNLTKGDSLLIPEKNEYNWKRSKDCISFFVAQDHERKRPF